MISIGTIAIEGTKLKGNALIGGPRGLGIWRVKSRASTNRLNRF
jgi:hypothetical protein